MSPDLQIAMDAVMQGVEGAEVELLKVLMERHGVIDRCMYLEAWHAVMLAHQQHQADLAPHTAEYRGEPVPVRPDWSLELVAWVPGEGE